ncbi:RE2 [Symbiodinium sp. CCMP2592]|nr:RE2 [Symbiodinium sp. CCMP2592]
MDLLAKGIQQLQQLQLRKETPEQELLKGSLELPKLPELYQDASSVSYLEWIYETGQVISSITDKAGIWWSVVLDLALEAYHRYQDETPLKRLKITLGTHPNADDEKWARLDKRVMALLLQCMTASVKQEVLMLRLPHVKDVLYKLYGESQQPQQSGRAEALVRVIKSRVKTLLRAASLPMSCWPLAAQFSARRQRDLSLGDRADEAVPFGAPVHVKHKRFGEGGRYDLAERWRSGKFVGYSSDVRGGRVVRHDDGSYTTSVHIKPYLVDSDDLVEQGPFEMEVEDPVRRIRGKSRMAFLDANPKDELDQQAKELMDAESYDLEGVTAIWELLKPHARSTTRSTQGEGLQWLIGQYVHGGQCGATLDTDRFPWATLYLVKAFTHLTGEKDFSILLTEDVGMKIHRDVHNHAGRDNVLLPVLPCERGGGVWVETEPKDYDVNDEWRQLPRGDWRRGRVHDLQPGVPVKINPRRFHQTEDWEGRRLVMTSFTPRSTRLKPPAHEKVFGYGFNPPPLPPQVPEQLQRSILKMMSFSEPTKRQEAVMFQMRTTREERQERAQEISQELQQLQDDVLGRLQERREWLQQFLAEEEILAEEFNTVGESIRDEIKEINVVVRELIKDVEDQVRSVEERCKDLYLKVANATDDKEIGDIEDYLTHLKKDSDVTLDVPLDQVKANLGEWIEPMNKELANLEEKTNAIEPRPMTEAKKLVNDGSLILIPGKVVFTVKPPAPETKAEKKSQGARWKRKARIVICGNLATQSLNGQDLYAAGASVEALRLALALASALGWIAAATDVSAAFLQAEWPTDRPTYGVITPRILVQAKLVPDNVVFVVKRALYGLRESPALWANHRTRTLREVSVDAPEGRVWLKPLVTDGELWMILQLPPGAERPQLRGLLVSYVDDLLYLAARAMILLLHTRIAEIWPCSALELSDQGLRYLGMELLQEENTFTLGQEAYVANLLRLHGLDPGEKAAVPCPKEWIQDTDMDGEAENFSPEELTRAQKITGECLWLAYRTRPDILYVTNYMAGMTARKPVKVYNVGLKVVAYLNATAGLKLKVESEAVPTTEPKQSAAAGKQSTVAMSVCEAELMEGSTCALLLESTQAMLGEIIPEVGTPTLFIDNMAAHNILHGSAGSWRTRHLRIRHSYVLNQVSTGSLRVCHLAGEDQPADLPTKLHSRARLLHLLEVWNMVGLPALDSEKVVKGLKLGCLFLLMLAVQSLAVAAEKEPLQVTGTSELLLLLVMTCIAAVALWEAGRAAYKWAVPIIFANKKSRRVHRLRDLAKAAAEAEIEKWVEEENVTSEQVTRSLREILREERQGGTLPTPSGQIEHLWRNETYDPADSKETDAVPYTKALKVGLEEEGLAMSGLKDDIVRSATSEWLAKWKDA